MNKALFGKQAWRILNNNDSLVVALLLPKYWSKEEFTKVKPQATSSWIWKSLLASRDVILKGLDVQVWSGEHTTFSEKRLIRCRPDARSRDSNLQNLICLVSHSWKFNLDCDSLNQWSVSFLHHRMFSLLGGHDKNVWKYNINGKYFVNSAYWMLANDHNVGVINNWNSKLWNRLWSLALPFKLVIFLWKLCANCLFV